VKKIIAIKERKESFDLHMAKNYGGVGKKKIKNRKTKGRPLSD